MRVVGVTGTKGKTSTCYLLRSILEAAGARVAMFTSAGDVFGDIWEPHALVTSYRVQLLKESGLYDVAIVEVTASTLGQRHLDGVHFDVGVFTNLTPDHQNVFKGMDQYLRAKMIMFQNCDQAIVNADDPSLRYLDFGSCRVTRFGMDNLGTDVLVRIQRQSLTGMDLNLYLTQSLIPAPVHVPATGHFNAYNVAAAAASARALDVDAIEIVRGLSQARLPLGRFEVIDMWQPFPVIVDFAHNAASLDAVLDVTQGLVAGRVLLVLGCGYRDPTRVKPMAEVLNKRKDRLFTFLTADPALPEVSQRMTVEPWECAVVGLHDFDPDRRRAIERALAAATPDDAVLMTGRGEQDRPYSDADVARAWLKIRYQKA